MGYLRILITLLVVTCVKMNIGCIILGVHGSVNLDCGVLGCIPEFWKNMLLRFSGLN
jgi:hypothetical protein